MAFAIVSKNGMGLILDFQTNNFFHYISDIMTKPNSPIRYTHIATRIFD